MNANEHETRTVPSAAPAKASGILRMLATYRMTTSLLAIGTLIAGTTPAFAAIDNTVTVTGSSPGNTDDVTTDDSESVDVEDAAPVLAVTKTADDTTDVAVGQTVTYTYTVTNTGNVSVTNMTLSDAHDGAGTAPTPTFVSLTNTSGLSDNADADNTINKLAPGDSVTFTSTYTVVQADLNTNGGGDGDIDNTVTASATYIDNTGTPDTVTGNASEEVDLEDTAPSLTVAKTADDTTDVVVGQLITYTYVVTNNGNVPVTNISLSDSHGGSGTAPVPTFVSLTNTSGLSDNADANNVIDTLYMGDSATFTATYTVTQDDVDAQ